MAENWFDESLEKLYNEIAEGTGLAVDQVQYVYTYLANFGLIDYDIEKELLYDYYVDGDE